MSLSIEIISSILTGVGASFAAASALSVIRDLLNRKMKAKIKFGGIEIEVGNKDKSEIYNQLVSKVKDLKIHPQVFIVYPHTQKEFARKLSNDLIKAGVKVWIDEHELKPGDKILPRIKEALKGSQWVLLIPPPEELGSSWVYKEINMAYEEEKGRSRPFIIPIKIKEGKIPDVFQDRMWADFSEKYENGIENLLSGIIRVPHHGSLDTEKASNK